MQSKTTRAFRTISEAGEELDLQPHVLRFWESKFPQIKPMKRGGGRRFYRPEDIEFLRGIKILLHDEKHPIKDVQKLIRVKGPGRVLELGRSVERAAKPKPIEETVLIPERIINAEDSGTPPRTPPASVVPPPAPPTPELSEPTPIPAPITGEGEVSKPTPIASFFRPVVVKPEPEPQAAPESESEPEVLDLTEADVEIVESPVKSGMSDDDREGLETALERLQALRARWGDFQKDG